MTFCVLSSITMCYHVSILLLCAIDVTCIPLRRRQWHPTPVLLPGKSHRRKSLEGWVHGVAEGRTWLHFNFHFHALEKEMATHSSVLAWRIPGTGEPCGLPSMGSHRVGHDWSDLAAAAVSHLFSAPLAATRYQVTHFRNSLMLKISWMLTDSHLIFSDNICACMRAQSCPTFCDPKHCSPPDSSVHGICQARKLEWVAISYSRWSS